LLISTAIVIVSSDISFSCLLLVVVFNSRHLCGVKDLACDVGHTLS
jgi:hypothetical protein